MNRSEEIKHCRLHSDFYSLCSLFLSFSLGSLFLSLFLSLSIVLFSLSFSHCLSLPALSLCSLSARRALEAENTALNERTRKLETKLATLQSHLKGMQDRGERPSISLLAHTYTHTHELTSQPPLSLLRICTTLLSNPLSPHPTHYSLLRLYSLGSQSPSNT